MSLATHCDAPECATWQRTASTGPRSGWVDVVEDLPTGAQALHFCSWDCVLHYAATLPPMEVIEA